MILTSTTEPDRFVAPWRSGDDATVYLIRAGSVRERGALEAELTGAHRAGRVYPFDLAAAVRQGVEQLLADDPEQPRILELLEQEQEVDGRTAEALIAGKVDDAAAVAAEIADADRQLIVQVRSVLQEHFAPYRELVAQQARRRELAPIEALRRFLVGVENGPDFARGVDGMVNEATLAALDPMEMMAAGNHAYSLLYGGGQKRPFVQPSASDDAPPTSKVVRSRGVGASKKTTGRKTPA